MRPSSDAALRKTSSLFGSLSSHVLNKRTLNRGSLMCAVALLGTVSVFSFGTSSYKTVKCALLSFERLGRRDTRFFAAST